MGQHGEHAREVLLDAAEELFARFGIDAVSNRRIAEHAGTANHSAVAYHFGGRDELLHALITRHTVDTDRRRTALVSTLADDAGLSDLLACLVLPWTEHLAALPVPSWRARFIHQMRTVPSMHEVLSRSAVASPATDALVKRIEALLGTTPRTVLHGRSWILGNMVLGVCSEYEARIQDGTEPANWTGVGYFLIDSCAGMLSAPVTHPGDFLTQQSPLYLP
ncbi:helix-turn-helix domain-containing protein [Arthrobacter sp. zg-Y820]|uniref:TetR/AcrR family transcriptional regulator n=1 Tax=unclassified Arthrobacter TaxID=235627 RepID=UPI001E54E31F|nr:MULTISPECIES: helix-turn-helix domain-containing protein [unclassified Arthrobacter]MCC9197607.1 TetR/AcrR family transcriptional regulator [Arthrobacter sp. zg-Y820]MDK1280474.1 helix-turn-helix domain-containing protein [Arthrobacter sp. zg.Y820]MDK1361990.1 helix-turn-helix domain-containing protein [Arthrobacter sp. zg-Y1219]WIB10884.1 helix-turn-helix domain-containing protein [Arthrobacter sp. zg-Y820]